MKKLIFIAIACFIVFISKAQVVNTSYINSSNEKVLQLSIIVPVDQKTTWEYFTKDAKLAEWVAPLVHMELRTGGYMVTNYDKNKPLTDSTSIRLGIRSFLEKELLILKVELNDHFSKKVQSEDENLQEIIQFIPMGPGKTKIISSMIGWGKGADWDKTYEFFVKGNEWTYRELLKVLPNAKSSKNSKVKKVGS